MEHGEPIRPLGTGRAPIPYVHCDWHLSRQIESTWGPQYSGGKLSNELSEGLVLGIE